MVFRHRAREAAGVGGCVQGHGEGDAEGQGGEGGQRRQGGCGEGIEERRQGEGRRVFERCRVGDFAGLEGAGG